MTVSLGHFLTLGAILFTIGVIGIFLNKKNVIIILMSFVSEFKFYCFFKLFK